MSAVSGYAGIRRRSRPRPESPSPGDSNPGDGRSESRQRTEPPSAASSKLCCTCIFGPFRQSKERQYSSAFNPRRLVEKCRQNRQSPPLYLAVGRCRCESLPGTAAAGDPPASPSRGETFFPLLRASFPALQGFSIPGTGFHLQPRVLFDQFHDLLFQCQALMLADSFRRTMQFHISCLSTPHLNPQKFRISWISSTGVPRCAQIAN